MTIRDILSYHDLNKEKSLYGRYITLDDITPLLKKWESIYNIEEIGFSENKLPIHLIKIGNGPKKLLFWSQMHGNESTTTKALFDLLIFLNSNKEISNKILANCTLYIIPMLNPDGAKLYTRANYNEVDLNRDAQNLSQKESSLFKKIVDKVNPMVAFNLHGQRTIFSAGETNKSAIVSFLSPASNPERTITNTRKVGMRIISEMNTALQEVIPDSVGRYDDGFNINCTGDTLENRGITTILFEAGHHPNDYDREVTRKWIFLSLVTSINFISNNKVDSTGYESYFDIPENGKKFNDIIIRNYSFGKEKKDVSIQFKENLKENKLGFNPYVFNIELFANNFGHIEFDAEKQKIDIFSISKNLKINNKIEKIKVDDKEFSVFPIKS